MRIHSPAGAGAASVSAWSAVSAGTGNAAAASHGTAAGFRATSAAGTTSHSAHAPWYRSGSGWVSTSSPGARLVTSSPTAATTPAACIRRMVTTCRDRRADLLLHVDAEVAQFDGPAAANRVGRASFQPADE